MLNDSQSLRGFLDMVEKTYPEEVLRIREPVNTYLDITSLVFELEKAGRNPVVIYENVEGHSMPIGLLTWAESPASKMQPALKVAATRWLTV